MFGTDFCIRRSIFDVGSGFAGLELFSTSEQLIPLISIMSLKKELKKAFQRVPPLRKYLKNHEDMKLYHAFNDREDSLWDWKLGPRAPIACVEAGRAQIRERVFLFGGYMSLSDVSDSVYVFDMKHERWDYLGKLPTGAPETHQGITSDGHRYIYLISGQAGGNCSPCSPRCFAFDAEKNYFSEMPPLPEACYMPVVYFHLSRSVHLRESHRLSGGFGLCNVSALE